MSRPVPVPDALSAPYWAGAAEGRLVLARCSVCGDLAHPPEPVCPRCGSTDPRYAYEPVGGSGTVRSWTVVHQSFLPGFETPFVLVDVELAAQPELRLIGRLLDGGEPAVGAAVAVAFEDDGVPAFTLVGGP